MVAFVVIICLERKFGIWYIFLFGSYSKIFGYLFGMCTDVHVFFIWYMWNLFRSCMDMCIMYRLTTTFLLLLLLADPWVLFVFLLTGFWCLVFLQCLSGFPLLPLPVKLLAHGMSCSWSTYSHLFLGLICNGVILC